MKHKLLPIILTVLIVFSLPVYAKTSDPPKDVWDGSIAESFAGGTGTKEDPYIIKTAAELSFFAHSVNEGNSYENMYITLAADIRLNDEDFTFDADTGLVKVTDGEHTAYFGTGVEGREGGNTYFDQTPSVKGAWYESDSSDTKTVYGGTLNKWTPIGDYKRSYDNRFRGHFDGNCHTVSGIYINSENTMIGLFGYALDARIEEIQIDNSLICGGSYTGSVAGYGNARFNGVTRHCINNAIVIGINCVGGIAGSGNSVYNCHNLGVTIGRNNVGGIIGEGYASDDYNNGLVYGKSCVGGIIGKGSIQTSSNSGTVYGEDMVGGIAGCGVAWQCFHMGRIIGNTDVGGIAGNCNDADIIDSVYQPNISQCYNLGSVQGKTNVGGIVGNNTSLFTEDSYNAGSVEGNKNVGGIGGYASSVKTCYSVGSIGGNEIKGAVIGYVPAEHTVEHCYYLAENGAVETGIGGCATAFKGYIAGINEEAMKLAETYVGFTFDEKYWKFDPEIHYEYPVLDRRGVEHGGHVFNQKAVDHLALVKEGTCTEPAIYYYTCLCKAVGYETFTVEPTHNFHKRADDLYHWDECHRCMLQENHAMHVWEEGTVTLVPTQDADGEFTYICTECTQHTIIPIPKEALPTVQNKPSTEEKAPSVPQDAPRGSIHPLFYVAIGIGVGLLIFYTFINLRQIRKEKGQ